MPTVRPSGVNSPAFVACSAGIASRRTTVNVFASSSATSQRHPAGHSGVLPGMLV